MFTHSHYLKRGAILSLEAMLYIALFVILIAMGTFGYHHFSQELKNDKARSDMSAISMAISQYHFEMKAYPKTLNDLTKKSNNGQYGPWIRKIEQDPWGHAYSYTTVTDGANGEYYLLVSGGADGTVQTTKLPSDTERASNDDIVVVSK